MDFLELRKQQLLHNFDEFEREFLPPYDPQSETKLELGKRTSWIEEMEQNFISDQLNIRKFHPPGSHQPKLKQPKKKLRVSNQIHIKSDLPPPLIEDLDFELPIQTNDTSNCLLPCSLSSDTVRAHHSKNMKSANQGNQNMKEIIVCIELSDTSLSDTTELASDFSLENLNMNIESPTQIEDVAYPPTSSSALLEELDYEPAKQTNYTDDPLIIGSSHSSLLTPPPDENMNPYDLMDFDDIPPLDPSFLEFIDFETLTSPHMEIDKSAYINKATTDYGEEFAKKVEGDFRVLQEMMNRTSQCRNAREKGERGVCCGGKCWRYMESKLRSMQKIPRGRKKKGFELTTDQITFKKQRQKIRNRESAAAAYHKIKAHIERLETQVKELKDENRLRRNLMKFLKGISQIPLEKRSLGRTTSGSI